MAKLYTREEIKQHNDVDCSWIVIHNNVYDVTAFLNEHPGGEEVLLEQSGRDGSEAFEDVGHSSDARELMTKFKVGEIVPSEHKPVKDKTNSWSSSDDSCPSPSCIFGTCHISKQKCEEYSKAVNVKQDSPLLLPNSGQILVSECGIVEVPLIVGGSNAQIKEFPHMAVLGFGYTGSPRLEWLCGGALISEQYILTASHCLQSRDWGAVQKVRLGIVHINAKDNLQEIGILSRIPHPKYKPPSKYNDIGLIKLASPAQFTAYVRPACLNFNDNIKESKAVAIGYGKVSYDSATGSKNLMKVQLTLVSNFDCQKTFSTQTERKLIQSGIIDSMVCAGDEVGGKDTCQGDSGGPLQVVLEEPYCMYSIIGVTSFGKFCGFPNSPAVYSRVSAYVQWIEDIVWK
ncbi:hypothetical protein FQA39_LY00640 [Lamprigera yunnana]|nr:hypothetical protein FQA39_LY00640 [Lamprigera yunnana]